MIRAIDNKPLDLSDDEFEYYLALIQAFGNDIFQNLIEVDEDELSSQYGFITFVKPPINMTLPIAVIYFAFNIMNNQRIRELDKLINIYKEKIKEMETKNG